MTEDASLAALDNMPHIVRRFFPNACDQIRGWEDENGEPIFIAADVAKILGFRHTPHMMRLLDEDEKGVYRLTRRKKGGNPRVRTITEPGLYSAIFKSRKPEARAFQDWVCDVVLPAIRRDGGYILGEEDAGNEEMSEDQLISAALQKAQKVLARSPNEKLDQLASPDVIEGECVAVS